MELTELKEKLKGTSITDQFGKLVSLYPEQVIFTTSFGKEDQVITHLIFENDIPVEVATIDTGRLFHETYKVFSQTFDRYNRKINVFFPDTESVEKMMSEKGPFSFYNSKENRLECCRLRKIVPLGRALKDKAVWISGIRKEQSEVRSQMDWIEYSKEKQLIKFYPLFEWSSEEVDKYIKEHNIPYNVLHDKGFISIGCEPCTRPVKKGEDSRSGRWWWETDSKKECGIHIK
jgi:phosphoadenosine phosphosulfate reductase